MYAENNELMEEMVSNNNNKWKRHSIKMENCSAIDFTNINTTSQMQCNAM